ncbi:hypothetical protein PLICRDRAFT_694750 [Plicaturopsis crispa FD-325 SS-3]|nr:hypothetical protein PLICRDRAFT_694750 [Plicaturopsis crispa FD-325 SS-3]
MSHSDSSALTDLDMSDLETEDVEMADAAPTVAEVFEAVDKGMHSLKQAMHDTALNERQGEWNKRMAPLMFPEPHQHKVAVVGRTGAGKSTVMNAILKSPLLPSSAEVLACTSTITEICYLDSDEFQVTISFVSKEDWRDELELLRDDLLEQHDPETGSPDRGDSSAAKSKVFEVYPQLRSKRVTDWSIDDLMFQEDVASRLGQEDIIAATDVPELQEKMNMFLTGEADMSEKPSLWPLVKIARIEGRFDVLATGTTLVDLPGHGDANRARDIAAETYLRTADHILLVADAKRARADIEMERYLRKILEAGVVDGRLGEGSISMVLTGADIKIGDREVQLNDDQNQRVQRFITAQREASTEITAWKTKEGRLATRGPKGATAAAQQAKKDKIKRKILELQQRQADSSASKNKILAQARRDSVHHHLESIYQQAFAQLHRDADIKPPALPMFSVGSRDYLAINGFESDLPTLFENEDDASIPTGIPRLQEHISRIGEQSSLACSNHLLEGAINLLGQVSASHKISIGRNKQLLAYERIVSSELDKWNQVCRQSVEQAVSDLRNALSTIEDLLGASVEEAEQKSIAVVQGWGKRYTWKKYDAIMRHKGVWHNTDLHDDLTEGILPPIADTWNTVLNVDIPSTLEQLQKDICKTTKDVIDTVERRAPKAMKVQIKDAAGSIGHKTRIGKALKQSLKSVSDSQRQSNRSFRHIVRGELLPHYLAISKVARGKGVFQRIKEKNMEYIQDNHDALFAAIPREIRRSFDAMAHSTQVHMDNALAEILATAKSSFIRSDRGLYGGQSSRSKVKKRRTVQECLDKTLPGLSAMHETVKLRLAAIS